MTLLDRFKPQSPQQHPDPAVRLTHVAEIPLTEREAIATVARRDQDPRVRKAAVQKLLDPAALGSVAASDPDEGVRAAAIAMLRDIALEGFVGITETESLEAVATLGDPRVIAQIARSATRDAVALRALSALTDTHAVGAVARHAASDAARLAAFETLQRRGEQSELVAVAMNGEHRDTALAAVDALTEPSGLEQIAARGRNRPAAKRARMRLQDFEARAATQVRDAADVARALAIAEAARVLDASTPAVSTADEGLAPHAQMDAAPEPAAADAAPLPVETSVTEQDAVAEAPMDSPAAVAEGGDIRVEAHPGLDPAGQSEPPPSSTEGAADAAEAQARARREAVGRLRHLTSRVEPLVAREDLSLKAAERALRDLRGALMALPAAGPDLDDIVPRLQQAQAALVPRVEELREATEWRQWANVGIQEQLCTQMEALGSVADPEIIARTVRELQQQWRASADVPRAQADALWRRFKAAHDLVWPRCEAHFAAEAEVRAANLARKTELCEKVEALADSTNWIQTADAIKALQSEWKTIGAVSRGREKAIWDRFRSACDRFFTRRQSDLAERKKAWADNFVKKEALCVRAETLAESTDWETAAAEVRRLQADWKTIGPVKKTRSEAIWQRFRTACDRFFTRYASRHDTARAERVAARQAICVEMEALASAAGPDDAPPADLLASIRGVRQRWNQEVASRGVDPDRARQLEDRLDAAVHALVTRWPAAFAGTELDPAANRKRMEALVQKVEDLLSSLLGPSSPATDASMSPTARLAAMLKEALAANTIGGKVDDESRWRTAADEVRQAKAAWARLGLVPDDTRRALASRFNQACARILAGPPGQGERLEKRGRPERPESRGRPPRRE